MPEFAEVSRDYVERLTETLSLLPHEQIEEVTTLLRSARADRRRIFVAGNGGSAATASHMECDLLKTIAVDGKPGLRVVALTDNMPLVTAIGNDLDFDAVFSIQLERLGERGDILIVISASGNSPNVLRTLEAARRLEMVSIALLGMGGGKARDMSDLSIVVDSDDYGIIEDAHMTLNHIITECLKSS